MTNVLIVEDEPRARAYLEKGLTEAVFTVDTASDGEAGLTAARRLDYAVIVCDVMLPKRDGFSLVAELRRAGRATPVLFVTALDEIDARVKGLELGGDDYIIKPFAFAELLARLRALLRRAAVRPVDHYVVGDLTCDPRSRRVERAGRRIDLTPREFALLFFLLERAGETLSRTLIADRVWGMNFDSDTNVIDVHMRRLRAKIEPPGSRPLLHTVRGVGYVFEDRGDDP